MTSDHRHEFMYPFTCLLVLTIHIHYTQEKVLHMNYVHGSLLDFLRETHMQNMRFSIACKILVIHMVIIMMQFMHVAHCRPAILYINHV